MEQPELCSMPNQSLTMNPTGTMYGHVDVTFWGHEMPLDLEKAELPIAFQVHLGRRRRLRVVRRRRDAQESKLFAIRR